MKLKESVALVTGANRGLGKAFVEALIEGGAARVYAAARAPWNIESSDRVVPIRLDIRSPEDADEAAQQYSDVNLIINNAGVGHAVGSLDPRSLLVARDEWETNVSGPLRLIQKFAPILAANGGGAVLNVLSALTWISIPGAFGTYAASKAALWSLTNSLRLDLQAQGTQVAALHVGFMDTDFIKGMSVPKTAPRVVAHDALAQLEAGAVEILADQVSQQLKQHLNAGVYLRAPQLG
jgi:NAD(P)-dependent dehydrogenase (short-subunit alcohol dehydrogenase family)